MRVLSLQKKLSLFIGGIILTAVLIAFFIIVPSLRQISELKRSINETEEYIERQYLRAQQTKKSLRHLDEVLSEVEKFRHVTLKKGEELKLITELEKLATQNNVNQKINLQFTENSAEEKKALNLPFYQISFTNAGNFSDLLNFLQDLEKLDYYLIIDSLRWEKERKGQEPNTAASVNVKFNAIVYATLE